MDPVPIIDLDTFQNCRSNNEAPSQVQAKQGNEPNGNNPPAQWVKNLVDHGIIPEQYQLAKLVGWIELDKKRGFFLWIFNN